MRTLQSKKTTRLKTKLIKEELGLNENRQALCCPIHKEDAIRQKAYEIYVQRGCLNGHDLDDWLEAERLVST